WLERLFNLICQFVGVKVLVWNRKRASTSSCSHRAPERLVTKEGNYYRWSPCSNTSCRGASAAVMDNTGYALEKPVVRAVAKHEHALWDSKLVGAEATPAFRYKGSLASLLHSFEYHLSHRIWIIN